MPAQTNGFRIKYKMGNQAVSQWKESIRGRLEERLNVLIIEKKINCRDKIQIRLSGDGTKVCRKLNLINSTFTQLNEGDLAKSPKGNHTISILNGIENYDDLKEGLLDTC